MKPISEGSPLNKLKHNIPERYKRQIRPYLPHALQLSVKALSNRKTFAEIETYCMFVGYPRSGHSLLGQLLNAHQHVVIAHERNVLNDLLYGYTRKQIFALILERDHVFANTYNRTWTGHDYSIPDSAQGIYTSLKVIGDKKGGASTVLMAKHPEVFGKIADMTSGLQLRVIHHVRNPFDNISTIVLKENLSLNEAIQKYFELVSQANNHLKRIEQIPQAATIETHHEDLIADPNKCLSRLIAFLNLTSNADYLDACSNVIYDSPNRSRDKVKWTPNLKKKVEERMQSYHFLARYTFDSR